MSKPRIRVLMCANGVVSSGRKSYIKWFKQDFKTRQKCFNELPSGQINYFIYL